NEPEMRRRLERIIRLQQRKSSSKERQKPSARRIVDPRQIFRESLGVEECSNRRRLFGLLVDHHRHSDTAVGMAPAVDLAPFVLWSVDKISPIRKRSHE